VQLVPEYSGDALDALAGGAEATPDPAETASALRRLAEARGLSVFDPNRDADAGLAVVVTFATAEDTRIYTVSGLARLDGVTVGVLEGQRRLQGLDADRVVELTDADAARRALHRGAVTAVVVPATSAGLAGTDDVMLVDDVTDQPANSVIPIANVADQAQRRTIYRILDRLAEELTTADLRELNRRVEIEGESPAAATRDLLEDKGLDG
jgi:osmoprotectant transport system substrate-binding protein